jgi:hypothetical protein
LQEIGDYFAAWIGLDGASFFLIQTQRSKEPLIIPKYSSRKGFHQLSYDVQKESFIARKVT